MMKINGEMKGSGILPAAQGNDSVSKNLQNQIAQAQKELQELSKNDQLSSEEKMKRRQELNQQINELSNQLKQHQTELRKEKMAEARAAKAESTEERRNVDGDTAGFTQAGMEAVLNADSSLKLTKIKTGVKSKLEGHARVLEAEIEADAGRGSSVEAKQKALSKLEQRIENISEEQIKELGEVNQKLKEENVDKENREQKENSEEKEASKKEEIENTTIDVQI